MRSLPAVLLALALMIPATVSASPVKPVPVTQTSDAWVAPDCGLSTCITLFVNSDGTGWSHTTHNGTRGLCAAPGPQANPFFCFGSYNDVASSFRIQGPPGTVICLWEHSWWEGDGWCKGPGVWTIPTALNDRVSSIQELS